MDSLKVQIADFRHTRLKRPLSLRLTPYKRSTMIIQSSIALRRSVLLFNRAPITGMVILAEDSKPGDIAVLLSEGHVIECVVQ